MQQGMTIGRLAKAAGVNVETIRYYQRRGLITEPHKPQGGQRRYPAAVVSRIGFIRHAQQLGFSLAEVKDLLQHSDGKNHRDPRRIAERKLAGLDLHIGELSRMRKRLKGLIDKSLKADGKGACPIITALADGK